MAYNATTLFDDDAAGMEERRKFLSIFCGSLFFTFMATFHPAKQNIKWTKQLVVLLTVLDLATTAAGLSQDEIVIYQTIKFILSSLLFFGKHHHAAQASVALTKPTHRAPTTSTDLMTDQGWKGLIQDTLRKKSSLRTQIQAFETSEDSRLIKFVKHVKNPDTIIQPDTPPKAWGAHSPQEKTTLLIIFSLVLGRTDKAERAECLLKLLGPLLLSDPDFISDVEKWNREKYFDDTALKKPLLNLIHPAMPTQKDDHMSDASSETTETESRRGSVAGTDETYLDKPTRPSPTQEAYELARQKAEKAKAKAIAETEAKAKAKAEVERKRAKQQEEEKQQKLQAEYERYHLRFNTLKAQINSKIQQQLERNAFLQEKIESVCSKAKTPPFESIESLYQNVLLRKQILEAQQQQLIATTFPALTSLDLEEIVCLAKKLTKSLEELSKTIDEKSTEAEVEYEMTWINALMLIDQHQEALQKCRSRADRLRISSPSPELSVKATSLISPIMTMQSELRSFHTQLTTQPSIPCLQSILKRANSMSEEITKWTQELQGLQEGVWQEQEHIKQEILARYAELDRLNTMKIYKALAKILQKLTLTHERVSAHLSEIEPTQKERLEPLLKELQAHSEALSQLDQEAIKIKSRLQLSRKIDMTSATSLSESLKEADDAVAYAQALDKIHCQAQGIFQQIQKIEQDILAIPRPLTPPFQSDSVATAPYFREVSTQLATVHPDLFSYLSTRVETDLERRLVVGSTASGTLRSDLDLLFLYCIPIPAEEHPFDYQQICVKNINMAMMGWGYTQMSMKSGPTDTTPYLWHNSSWQRQDLSNSQAVDITLNFAAAGCMEALLEKSLRERVISAKAKAMDLSTATLHHFGDKMFLCKKREDLSLGNHEYIIFYLTYILAHTPKKGRSTFLKQYGDTLVLLAYDKSHIPPKAAHLFSKKTGQPEEVASMVIYESLTKIEKLKPKAKQRQAPTPY